MSTLHARCRSRRRMRLRNTYVRTAEVATANPRSSNFRNTPAAYVTGAFGNRPRKTSLDLPGRTCFERVRRLMFGALRIYYIMFQSLHIYIYI